MVPRGIWLPKNRRELMVLVPGLGAGGAHRLERPPDQLLGFLGQFHGRRAAGGPSGYGLVYVAAIFGGPRLPFVVGEGRHPPPALCDPLPPHTPAGPHEPT